MNPETTSQPPSHPLALPPTFSPDDLDPLTDLAVVLAKVRAHIQATTSQDPNHPNDSGTGATSSGANASQQQSQQGQQISFKDVPRATDALKHKMQRARVSVGQLPDMQRSIEQQKTEMRELEEKIALQKALLGRLREDGTRFGTEDGATAEKMDVQE